MYQSVLNLLFFLLLFSVNVTSLAEELVFTIKVSGELMDRLPDDTELHTVKLPFDKSNYKDGDALPMIRAKVADLPFSVPAEPYLGISCQILFWSPSQGALFTVFLSHDLFDKPREINILLNRPQPVIRPSGSFAGFSRYTARITNRMEYYELPRIDLKTQKFVKPSRPAVVVTNLKTGEIIHEARMEIGCMGSRWWGGWSETFPNFESMGFKHQETYRFSVAYDSGGLFPPMISTCDFTYDEWRH